MDRDTAVTRITDGLGFVTAHGPKAILRLQEAQRDLEKGKTLPHFLQTNLSISTVAGTLAYVFPERFLRLVDSEISPLFYFQSATDELPVFLQQASLTEALTEFSARSERGPPKLFVLDWPNLTFIFAPPPDAAYVILGSYYKGGEPLTSNVENSWLSYAPEWLIGEAGMRLAADLRDAEAVALFQAMAQKGRAATFGETLAAEDQYGAISLGMSA